MSKSYYVGRSPEESMKLDLYYTDSFVEDVQEFDGIRMANISGITAMKLDVVQRTGRKKNFWDFDRLAEDYTINEMFAQHEKRYLYTNDRELLIDKCTDFTDADGDFEPMCLKGKHWEFIKLNMIEFIDALSN